MNIVLTINITCHMYQWMAVLMLFAGFSNGYTNFYCSFFDKKYFSYWTLLVKALLHCAIESTPSYLAAACIFGMINDWKFIFIINQLQFTGLSLPSVCVLSWQSPVDLHNQRWQWTFSLSLPTSHPPTPGGHSWGPRGHTHKPSDVIYNIGPAGS